MLTQVGYTYCGVLQVMYLQTASPKGQVSSREQIIDSSCIVVAGDYRTCNKCDLQPGSQYNFIISAFTQGVSTVAYMFS